MITSITPDSHINITTQWIHDHVPPTPGPNDLIVLTIPGHVCRDLHNLRPSDAAETEHDLRERIEELEREITRLERIIRRNS